MNHISTEATADLGRALSVQTVIREVAQKHGLTWDEMLGDRRDRHLTAARQEAYYRCQKETRASSTTIGRLFGNRDHTTIIKGAKKYQERIKP